MTQDNERFANLDTFFQPLVGTPRHLQNFQNTLTEYVRSEQDQPDYDPFVQLSNGVLLEIDRVIADRDAPDQVGADEGNYSNASMDWYTVNLNAQTGVAFVMATLKTVSRLYQTKTQVPQEQKQVKQQTLSALRHTQGIAFSTAGRGASNICSLRSSIRPGVLSILASGLWPGFKKTFEDPKVSRRSYITSLDAGGDLLLRPRHKMHQTDLPGRGCPAAFRKVEHAGRRKSALTLFVQTIGEVAISEVFPQQFEIAP